MNKMRTVLIILLTLTLLLTACGRTAGEEAPTSTDGTADQTATSAATTAATAQTEPAETGPAGPQIEAIDGGGTEFRILGRKSGADEYYLPFAEFHVEIENGDIMNDAVFARNLFLAEKYNITVVADEDTPANIRKAVQNNVLANDATYDIYMPTTEYAFGLALEGNFMEIDSIRYIDIEKPWWMGETMANLSILNDNYFLLGDIAFSNFIASSSITFNQVLATEYNLPDMYQLVRDGKWTIEKMHEICLQITRDLDGDGDIDNGDLWGASVSNFVWQPLYFGSGVNLIEKDTTDTPYLVWESEKNMAVIERMTAFLNDGDAVLVSQQHSDWKVDNRRNFMESRSLFRIEQLYGLQQIREVEFEYGILPAPKYEEAQEFYYSYVHPKQSQAICIPITNNRLELTGAILEDAAYQSYLTIRPAYYDVTLQGKLARNEDTVEMLNIMLAHLNPDLSVAMVGAGLTIDTDMRSIYTSDLDQYTSIIKASARVNAALLQKAVDKVAGLKK